MSLIWTKTGSFVTVGYAVEADLEDAVLQVKDKLFGPNRVYLDIKKKIGAKGSPGNIPDGYLIDLTSRKPRLYVVENELASHDPIGHVATQLVSFSRSFSQTEKLHLKETLRTHLEKLPDTCKLCETYARKYGFSNLDRLLEVLVFEVPFTVLVIIDELNDYLKDILLGNVFQFDVEVLELEQYENQKGEKLYRFTPFLSDVEADILTAGNAMALKPSPTDTSDLDTVVVPAREDGFKETFLGENRWYSIRIHANIRPQLRYIAAYRVAPESAITHLAPIKSIEPWQDSGKYVVNFAEPALEIGRISLVKKGRVKPLYNLRDTTRQRLLSAKTLDEVW